MTPAPAALSNPLDVVDVRFVEGLSAARGRVAAEACPYAAVAGDAPEAQANAALHRLQWMEGWAFGTFAEIQHQRVKQAIRIREAVAAVRTEQAAWTLLGQTIDAGLLKSGRRYFAARRELGRRLSAFARDPHRLLLQGVGIEVDMRPSGSSPSYSVWDQQFQIFGRGDTGDVMRRLVTRYRERHGVLAAWDAYCGADEIPGVRIPG